MEPSELDMGAAATGPRTKPRKAALDALERLLRAHQVLGEQRDQESPYGLLRPGEDDELDLIEAVFLHCGVPLPDTLRAIYRRTLGVGNPVSPMAVLSVPVLRAALPDEGYGSPVVGLESFEEDMGFHRDDAIKERPPFLFLGHAAPLGLTVSRNGLWSLKDYQGGEALPQPQDFGLVFEAAFCTFVDQLLLIWANDLAGALVRTRDLDMTQGARLASMPRAVQEAFASLVAPRSLSPKAWGNVQPLASADLLRATRRSESSPSTFGSHVTVVGLPYGDHPEDAARIGLGDRLCLRPVDDNPHDPNAVEVWRDGETSTRIGFVARAEAPWLRTLPHGASAWRLRVRGRSDNALYATLEKAEPSPVDGGRPAPGFSPQGGDLFSGEK